MNRRHLRRLGLLPLAALLLALGGSAAAYFTATGTGTAVARAGTLNAPTGASATSTHGTKTVHIDWTPSSTADGVAPQGYYVLRRPSAGGTQVAACGLPDSTIAGPGCTELEVPDGSYVYTVVAVFRSWTARSEVSAPVSVVADITPPTVTVAQAVGQADPTASLPIRFGVHFDESVTGFSPAGVELSGTAGAAAANVSVAGSGRDWSITVDAPPAIADGTIVARVRAGAAQDATGNASTASTSTDDSVRLDRTAPVVTVDPARAPDQGGFYNRPVQWTAHGTDAGGIASCTDITYSGPDSPTASVTRSCTDLAGNVGTGTATFAYDDHAPKVTLAASPAAPDGSAGWYRTAVTWIPTGVDPVGGSGGVTCQAAVLYSGPDTGSASVTRTCTDLAGNTGTATAPFKWDATAPSGAITAPGAGSVSGQVVLRAATAADATSGVATVAYRECAGAGCTPATLVGTGTTGPSFDATWDTTDATPGTHVLRAEIVDAAGNRTTTAPVTVTVVNAYTFSVSTPATQRAGTPFGSLTIRLLANGTPTGTYAGTAYSGAKAITFSGPAAAPAGTAPVYPATVSFTDGAATLPASAITLYKAGSTTLTARDAAGVTGTSGAFAVDSAGVALSFDRTCPVAMVRNSTLGFAVRVPNDAYGNAFTRTAPLAVGLAVSNGANFSVLPNPLSILSGSTGATFDLTETGANKTTSLTATVAPPFTAPAACTVNAG